MVADTDTAFEIQYRRLNEETSIAEPTMIRAYDTDRKIWKFWGGCAFACRKINDKPKYEPLTEPIPTIKLVADDSKRSGKEV